MTAGSIRTSDGQKPVVSTTDASISCPLSASFGISLCEKSDYSALVSHASLGSLPMPPRMEEPRPMASLKAPPLMEL